MVEIDRQKERDEKEAESKLNQLKST